MFDRGLRWTGESCAIVALVVVVAGCSRGERSPAAGRQQRQQAAVAAARKEKAASSELIRRMERVVTVCRVAPAGGFVLRGSCSDPDAEDALRRAEQAAGFRVVLDSYCRVLSDERDGMAALAVYRLRDLSQENENADAEALGCLVDRALAMRQTLRARQVVAVAATMAARDGHALAILEKLRLRRNPALLDAAYASLWEGGRLHALPMLTSLLADTSNTSLRRAVLRGFSNGAPMTPPERAEVCKVLQHSLGDTVHGVVAEAAYRTVMLCDGPVAEVLAVARRALKEGWFETALSRSVARCALMSGTTAAQRKESLTLLSRAVTRAELAQSLRAGALEALEAVDHQRAVRLSRLLARNTAGPLGLVARRVIHRPRTAVSARR